MAERRNERDPVRELFERVSVLDGEARARAMEEARRESAEVAAEVEALLGYHEGSGILDKAPSELGAQLAADAGTGDTLAGTLAAGTKIGKYTIKRVIGVGGMGVVYEAEQEFPKRAIALKLVRSELVTGAVIRRFEAEASTLGLLQHPGIAQVFDAGKAVVQEAQRPYIAMELVTGEVISKYVENMRGTGATGPGSQNIKERILRLMMEVCDAVQHAHQRGVIHRDLKPGNILVNERGEVKVLDFGIARLTGSEGSQQATGATSVGQILGTLGYMSPEQALGDPRSVDTRSDVYALGVILYELLCGQRPIGHGTSTVAQAIRALTEDDAKAPSVFDAAFRGDIDVIVLRAIEKKPERRYQSAEALREDLRRHLEGLPIEARRDSATYVLGKQIKRYRGVVAAGLVAIVGLGFFGVSSYRQAKSNARLAEQLAKELSNTRIERARLLARTDGWTGGEEALWREFVKNPRSENALWALRELYLRVPLEATTWEKTVGFASAATATGMAPDTRVMAGVTRNGELQMWRGDLGAKLWETKVAERVPGRVSMSGDGTLVSVGAPGAVVLVDGRSGEIKRRVAVETSGSPQGVMSQDGTRVYVCVAEGELAAINTADGSIVARSQLPGAEAAKLTLSGDGRTLIATLRDGSVVAYDAAAMKREGAIDLKDVTRVMGSTFLKGDALLALSSDSALVVLEREGWKEKARVPLRVASGTRATVGLNFLSAIDERHVVGVTSSMAVVVDVVKGEIVMQVPFGTAGGAFVTQGPRDGSFICSPEVGWARLVDMRASGVVRGIGTFEPTGFVKTMGLPNGRAVAVVSEGGELRVFAAADERKESWSTALTRRSSTGLPGVDISRDGSTLVTLNGAGTLTRYSTSGWTSQSQTRTQMNPERGLVVSPDGKLAVFATRDSLQSWSLETETKLAERPIEGDERVVMFTEDGEQVRVFNGKAKEMLTLNARTLEVRQRAVTEVQFGTFIPDREGRSLARRVNRKVQIVEPRTMRVLAEMSAQTGAPVMEGDFDSGAVHVAAVTGDGVLTVWNARTGVNLLRTEEDRLGTLRGMALLGSIDDLAVVKRGGEVMRVDMRELDRWIARHMNRWAADIMMSDEERSGLEAWGRRVLDDASFVIRTRATEESKREEDDRATEGAGRRG